MVRYHTSCVFMYDTSFLFYRRFIVFELSGRSIPLSDIRHEADAPMSAHTTFRVGGCAKEMFFPKDMDELLTVKRSFAGSSARCMVVGKGSNLLFDDKGYDGDIISIGRDFAGLEFCETDDGSGALIRAQAGILLKDLALAARNHGLTGLEFAYGIPGTLGGAVVMNAGAYGGEMKDVIESVIIIDENCNVRTVPALEMDFGYRHSAVTEKQIVAGAVIRLSKGNAEEIKAKMDDFQARRREKQPLNYASAGSTFKRPEGYFAGRLIEDSGLKGYRVGDACVSEKHAGFVVNLGHATASDIKQVIADVQRIVYEKQGVHLEPEVRIIQ